MNKVLSLTAVAAVSVVAFAVSSVTSGLQPGERVTPFHPSHVVGPLAGTSNCFPCTFQNRPQVQVWVNGDDKANVVAFAKTLAKAMESHKDKEFKALVVFVAPESKHAELSKTIKDGAKMMGATNVGMALIDPSNEAVSNYKINLDKSVKNTVLVYKDWKVQKSFVNLKADKAGLGELSAAINSITN
jgi:hypothetical protein